jgi:hypothetical protein
VTLSAGDIVLNVSRRWLPEESVTLHGDEMQAKTEDVHPDNGQQTRRAELTLSGRVGKEASNGEAYLNSIINSFPVGTKTCATKNL